MLSFRHSAKSSVAQNERLAPPAGRDRSEDARAYNQRCHHHTGKGGLNRSLSSISSFSLEFSIYDQAMGVIGLLP